MSRAELRRAELCRTEAPRLRGPRAQPALAPGVLEHHRRPRRWPRLVVWSALAALLPALAYLALS